MKSYSSILSSLSSIGVRKSDENVVFDSLSRNEIDQQWPGKQREPLVAMSGR
jgi:hypothetical protein